MPWEVMTAASWAQSSSAPEAGPVAAAPSWDAGGCLPRALPVAQRGCQSSSNRDLKGRPQGGGSCYKLASTSWGLAKVQFGRARGSPGSPGWREGRYPTRPRVGTRVRNAPGFSSAPADVGQRLGCQTDLPPSWARAGAWPDTRPRPTLADPHGDSQGRGDPPEPTLSM